MLCAANPCCAPPPQMRSVSSKSEHETIGLFYRSPEWRLVWSTSGEFEPGRPHLLALLERARDGAALWTMAAHLPHIFAYIYRRRALFCSAAQSIPVVLDFRITGMAVAALFGRYLDEDGRVGPSHEGMHEGAPAGGRRARPRPPPGSVIRTVLRRAANVTGRPVRRRPEPGTFNPRRRAPASYGRWSPCCWSVTSTSLASSRTRCARCGRRGRRKKSPSRRR